MKVLKPGLILALVVFFAVACGTPEANKNSGNANQPSTSPTTNTNQGPAATASNSNAAAPNVSSNSNSAAAPSPRADAAALFVAQKCVGCHGQDGKGKLKGTPNFTDAAWQKKEKDADLIQSIKKGRPPKMPPFGSKLTDDEVKALVAYVRTFSGK